MSQDTEEIINSWNIVTSFHDYITQVGFRFPDLIELDDKFNVIDFTWNPTNGKFTVSLWFHHFDYETCPAVTMMCNKAGKQDVKFQDYIIKESTFKTLVSKLSKLVGSDKPVEEEDLGPPIETLIVVKFYLNTLKYKHLIAPTNQVVSIHLG